MKKYISGLVPAIAAIIFSAISLNAQTKVVAHRGFWNCEAAGYSENSIASLKAAQDAGLWGSECDIQLTADNVIIVNHDGSIKGKVIRKCNFADFKDDLLPNGERRPSFDEYLTQCEKCPTTILVVEFKKQESVEAEDMLVDKAIETIKAHGLFSPDRVAFISFSKHICQRIVTAAPGFINQYLNGELSPKELAALGINGFDYHFRTMKNHPGWIKQAAKYGLSTNTWTVNDKPTAKWMIKQGVGAITTNYPLMVKELLSDK